MMLDVNIKAIQLKLIISGLELTDMYTVFFFSSRRRHTRLQGDWSSDVCSSDLHHQGQQRLGDGRCADADAGVVAALGDDLGALALHVDGFARRDDGTGGLDAYAHFQVLARADAADDATGVVAAKAFGTQRVAVRGAALDHAFEDRK